MVSGWRRQRQPKTDPFAAISIRSGSAVILPINPSVGAQGEPLDQTAVAKPVDPALRQPGISSLPVGE